MYQEWSGVILGKKMLHSVLLGIAAVEKLYIYIYIYIYVCVCMFVCMCVCVCVCVSVYVCKSTYSIIPSKLHPYFLK